MTAGHDLHIDSPGLKTLSNRTLVNAGTGVWSGDSVVILRNAATISNPVGASFECTGDGTMENGGGPTSQFLNAGVFRKTGGPGITRMMVPFNNTGTVEVKSGSLSLDGGERTPRPT